MLAFRNTAAINGEYKTNKVNIMNLTFREANEADYPAIIELHKSQDWGLDTPRTIRNFQEQGNSIIVGEQNKEIIGKMDLMPKKRDNIHFLYLERLILAPEHRNKGIGKQFIQFAEEQAKKRNLKFLDLAVRDENDVAKKLYTGSGFEIIGRKVYMRKNVETE
ncbi:MAG: GNAT family N-acetyltransferase [Nanoarchaeota archaeon]